MKPHSFQPTTEWRCYSTNTVFFIKISIANSQLLAIDAIENDKMKIAKQSLDKRHTSEIKSKTTQFSFFLWLICIFPRYRIRAMIFTASALFINWAIYFHGLVYRFFHVACTKIERTYQAFDRLAEKTRIFKWICIYALSLNRFNIIRCCLEYSMDW